MLPFFNKIIVVVMIGLLVTTSAPIFSGTTDSSQISAPDVKAMQLKAKVDTAKAGTTPRLPTAEGAGDQILKECPDGTVLVQIQNTDQKVYWGEASYCMQHERYCAGPAVCRGCPTEPANCCKFVNCHVRTRCKTWSPTKWQERNTIPAGTSMNQPSVLSQGVCAPVSNEWKPAPR